MKSFRVIGRWDRLRPRKSLEDVDGTIYKLEKEGQTRYLILWDFTDRWFDKEQDYSFINPECLKWMEEKAAKDGNKGYNVFGAMRRMDTFPPRRGPAVDTGEKLSAAELKIIRQYEFSRAVAHFNETGYWALPPKVPRDSSDYQFNPIGNEGP